MTKKDKDWEQCWKINCTPPLEVYATHINFFGSVINREQFECCLEQKRRNLDFLEQAVEIWHEKFEI